MRTITNRGKRLNPFLILSLIAITLLSACREEADVQVSYGQGDFLPMMEAQSSYRGKFKTLWLGLNNNYGIWDYESEHGLNWDAVYDEYLPKFEALDQRKDSIEDEEIEELLKGAFAPLHDGHLAIEMKNASSGNMVSFSPSAERNKTRKDFDFAEDFTPDLTMYLYATGDNSIVKFDETNTYFASFWKTASTMSKKAVADSIAQIIADPSVEDAELLLRYQKLQSAINDITIMMADKKVTMKTVINLWNETANLYADLDVPGVYTYDIKLSLSEPLNIQYAQFSDGIVYLNFSSFALSYYLDDKTFSQTFGGYNPSAELVAGNIKRVWKGWFNDIQELHANGKLKGVVIDIRSNGGGASDDYQYVVGALVPAGGHSFSHARYKNGVGRYDYSPLIPHTMKTMEAEHATITEPIVALCNTRSVSMAEITSLGVKSLTNGHVIGKPSWGGLCMLYGNSSKEAYSMNYSGHIGDMDNGPIYAYIPTMIHITSEGILEGKGVTPDIDQDFDESAFKQTGKDTQLERALEYIRTGN